MVKSWGKTFSPLGQTTLVDERGVVATLAFVALIAGGTMGLAFTVRTTGVACPATLASLAGGVATGLGGQVLTRVPHRVRPAPRPRLQG